MPTKLKVYVTETLTHRREAIVTLPMGDVLTDASIDGLMDRVEYYSESADDVMHHLTRYGCSVVSPFDDCLEYPDSSEVEITDYKVIEEAKE